MHSNSEVYIYKSAVTEYWTSLNDQQSTTPGIYNIPLRNMRSLYIFGWACDFISDMY